MAIGAVLDWSGVAYSSRADRGICIAAAVLIAVTAAFMNRGRERLPLLLLIPAAVALNMAVINIRDISGHHFEYARYPDASVGIGLYVICAGVVLTGVAAVIGFVDRRRRGRSTATKTAE